MADEQENSGMAAEGMRLNWRIAVGVFLGLVVCGVGAYGAVFGFGRIGNFFQTGSALVSETLGDIFYGGKENSFKLVDEIDLTNGNLNTEAKNSAAAQTGVTAGNYKQPADILKSEKSDQTEVGQSASGTPSNGTKKSSAKSTLAVSAAAATSSKIVDAVPICDFSVAGSATHKIIFSEIAWMGSPKIGDETAAQASQNEWIELENNSDGAVDLTGWQILDESEKFNIIFSGGDGIAKNEFYLLERTDDDSVPGASADKIYSGALPNTGEWLRIFDDGCVLVDEINASGGWPGGDNTTKQTLERNAGDFSWYTSAAPGGTPKAANSAPIPALAATSSAALDGVQLYALGVSIQGGGTGLVTSSPVGIYCGFDCSEQFGAGTKVVLGATPDVNSAFENWSGACSGAGDCAVVVTSTVSVAAIFKSNVVSPPLAEVQEPVIQPPLASDTNANTHVVVNEVMAGSDSNAFYEFVEFYNPTSQQIDLTGWFVKKRSSTGSESSLVVASRFEGKVIGAGKYFLLANASSGISVAADVLWPQSYGLAYKNNAVVLYDASGAKVDEVAWTDIPAGRSYEREPTGDQFVIHDPTPQGSASN
jgi:hypothetical protein